MKQVSHRVARRNMLSPAPDMRGFTSIVKISNCYDDTKPLYITRREIFAQISFDLGNGLINIHSEPAWGGKDGWRKFDQYTAKLRLLRSMVSDGILHISSKDPTRWKEREWLNEDGDNNYGSSFAIDIPALDSSTAGFCVLEISDCNKKVRIQPGRKELLRILKKMLNHIEQHYGDCKEGEKKWKVV
ncbi:hypothetical protein D5W64_12240 [Salmonella enterica subsp. enterica serovar Saintpaul]|nr:hypothetical protein [Salmonella enterica subsp. enterica serovar Saintpaul]